MKKLFIFASILTVTACNTVAGIGEDISGSANWVKDEVFGKPVDLGSSANENKPESVQAQPEK